jgi:hypothetical protein
VGYKLSSLVYLPIDSSVEIYVFSIGDRLWEGGLGEVVQRNFDALARSIGPNAIIVGGLEDEFHGEVVEKYLGRHHAELKNLMPALLITDAHPEHLTDKSLRILIPLREAHERYKVIDDFLRDLAAFVRGENDDLLRTLEGAPTPADALDDIVRVNVPVVPGVVAVNLNSAVRHMRAWWQRRDKSKQRWGAGTSGCSRRRLGGS